MQLNICRNGNASVKRGIMGGVSRHYSCGKGRDGALCRPRHRAQRQVAQSNLQSGHACLIVPLPDAALGDGDGAARHPYQRHAWGAAATGP